MASTASAAASTRPPAARMGPGPAPRSGPAAPLDAPGLAAATVVGTAIRVPEGETVADGAELPLPLGLAVGLGAGVDGPGVGVGPTTVTVPFSVGWIEQWYAYVPATAKDTVLFPPGAMTPVSNRPWESDVAVWPTGSRSIHVTLSPMPIVTSCGWYAKFWMTTLWLTASAGAASKAPHQRTIAAMRATHFRRS